MRNRLVTTLHEPKGFSFSVIAEISTTTFNLDREYLSWQLSIYAYLFELQNPLLKVDGLFGIWLRGTRSELIPIERKLDAEVKRLMECEVKGEQFQSTELVPANEKQLLPAQLINTIIEIEEQEAYVSEMQKDYKEKIKAAMKEFNVKKWDSGRLCVSYTPPTVAVGLDSKRFQAEHPDLYAKYSKTTIKADSIRITIREEK